MTTLIEGAPVSGAVDPALPPATPRTVHVLGNLITFLMRGADTGMRFSMVDCRTAPGAGTPPHFQADEETFIVLEGQYELMVGGETLSRGPNTVTTVPAGVPHAFRNPGTAPARMLIVNWPADAHERFFLEIGDPVAAGGQEFPRMGAPDMAHILAAAAASGITLLLPPGE